jgi:hypothetical protein
LTFESLRKLDIEGLVGSGRHHDVVARRCCEGDVCVGGRVQKMISVDSFDGGRW